MHELGLVQRVIEIVTEAGGGARVARVVLEVGALAAVSPDALRFAFEVATEGSVAEGATLDIVVQPGLGKCRACGLEVPLSQPFGQCPCGGTDLTLIAGNDLRIKQMEMV